ncbi:MAG TPA: transcription antitermination factor NusB [Acidobacteriota bacterium]
MGSRRKGRELALKILYQKEARGAELAITLASFWSQNPVDSETRAFAERLAEGVIEHSAEIDELITASAHHWRLDRMYAIDRNLLRLAVFELVYELETPPKVVINEAIEVAKRYGTQKSPHFVNGVLDGVKRYLETREPVR